MEGDQDWKAATVPGCVHQDLFNNGKIPDPFFGTNEKDLQWIMNNDWVYRLSFKPIQKINNKKCKILRFHGIDTYADIFLNNKKIISANNMFHPWEIDISEILLPDQNEIIVHFRSPIKKVLPVLENMSYRLPADNDQAGDTSPFTRKAPYHYGWDWGPCFVTSGLWKNVELFGWDHWYINKVNMVNEKCTDKIAELTLEGEIISDTKVDLDLRVFNQKSGTNEERTISLIPGKNIFQHNFSIKDPERWWPSGQGDQPLYTFNLSIQSSRQEEYQKIRIGLREIKILRNKDQSGESFEIQVNGRSIFAKGANWIPADSFVTRLDRSSYKKLLISAVNANMNTLRVWGGGIYEPDCFYELCDELGILIWQDFMFACSMYPADIKFLDSVEREARYQVNRLKSHPCIALWCGNNEIASGWLSWGWKEELPNSVWKDYKSLFHRLLPDICSELDPYRLYWPSSPGHSISLPESDQIYGMGDNHYWGVWHGGDNFEAFEENIGRFMSEYGMQSFPDLKTIESFAEESDLTLESDVIVSRQKASLGTGNLIKYIEKYFSLPTSFNSIAALSQILQAQAIKKAVETHRRNMPFCMGTLYWQLNDCWPAISWSSIDYFGNWKALHYLAKRFFNPILISIYEKNENIEVYVINDQDRSIEAELLLLLYNFDNRILNKKLIKLKLKPLCSECVLILNKEEYLKKAKLSDIFLYASLDGDLMTLSQNNFYFLEPKHLKLPKPKFDCIVSRQSNSIYNLSIKARSFLYQLHFLCINVEGIFSDNYFDMLSGEEINIEFGQSRSINTEDQELLFEIKTLYDLTHDTHPLKIKLT